MTKTDAFKLSEPEKFHLNELSTAFDLEMTQNKIEKRIQKNTDKLAHLQEKLYAQNTQGVLIIFQAMDAAGKDSMIQHVMSGVNPQGTTVTSFKQPTDLELDHDFLWRVHQAMPARGDIGVFNRSYYEDVLITRVHPEILLNERIPGIQTLEDIKESFYKNRYEIIQQFESYLAREGFTIIKFFLHISKEEQKERFLRRLDIPEKNWKFSSSDLKERAYWEDYQAAYSKMIEHTSTKENPWYVIPSDDKWTSRYLVSKILKKRFKELDLAFPTVDEDERKKLEESKQQLLGEKG